jgi:hypothetical protein
MDSTLLRRSTPKWDKESPSGAQDFKKSGYNGDSTKLFFCLLSMYLPFSVSGILWLGEHKNGY